MRAPLSPLMQELRHPIQALSRRLQASTPGYASVYVERKAAQSVAANLKQTQSSEKASLGCVLRIYDGYTLFEEATDDLSEQGLHKAESALLKRVRAAQPSAGVSKRAYAAPSWAERLNTARGELDPEILEQIPTNPLPDQWVHFGVRYDQDPCALTTEARVAFVQDWVNRMRKAAQDSGLSEQALSFASARLGIAEEESLFVDAGSALSQTLYRVSLALVTLSGSDRTSHHSGGLGGMEAAQVGDAELRVLLTQLRALKGAPRIEPGKYNVIFGPEVTGVLAHEAFGHSQEADTCARGRSKAWDLFQSGSPVGNSHATILNNPAVYRNGTGAYAAWGSYFFDEEGWLAQEQVILDRGVLRAPMTNLTSALRLGVARSANGKRESWSHGVYTRQTNTYFSPGDRTLEQLMQELGDGYLAIHPAGGMEDPKGMGIQVGIAYLQEVRAGKTTGRLFRGPAGGDIQMTGYTPDVLSSIRAKSKIQADSDSPDQAKHPFNDVGGCGKYHKEFVYAGCGGPYMLMQGVNLG